MDLHLQSAKITSGQSIRIAGSKSESNRLLLLQALYPNLIIENSSDSDDSQVMRKALSQPSGIIDIHHAGTAMRFLTAYFAIQENSEIILTGSTRMQERPIKILVDALRLLGADITYEINEGLPPLRIKGKKLKKSQISLQADVSSQYISALLLIAPQLENGLELTLEGKITSIPYINMTLGLLNEVGVKTTFIQNIVTVYPINGIPHPISITVESDWSSASYYYSVVALSDPGTEITLSSYKQNSYQGDSALATIYKSFGVDTFFVNGQIVIRKMDAQSDRIAFDLNHTPDIAQTIAVTCFGLGIESELTGLHTLKIKETDRLEALQTELIKLGASVTITEDSFSMEAARERRQNIKIATYNDHRMAMAFAPLALRIPIIIEDANVVSKSYPAFWTDLKDIGFSISEI